jgi:hypothetical protein
LLRFLSFFLFFFFFFFPPQKKHRYLEIRLRDAKRPVGGLAIQGRAVKSEKFPGARQFVTAYTLSYKATDGAWVDYREGGVIRTFRGNMDPSTKVKSALENPIVGASAIRIHPVAWYAHIALRVELFDTKNYRRKLETEKRVERELAEKRAAERAAALKAKIAAEKRERAAKAEAAKRAADKAAAEARDAAAKRSSHAAKAEQERADALAAAGKKQAAELAAALKKFDADNVARDRAIAAESARVAAELAAIKKRTLEHRAKNVLLRRARETRDKLRRSLNAMRLDAVDNKVETKTGDALHKNQEDMVRKLGAELAKREAELADLEDKVAGTERNREKEIRDGEDRAYHQFLKAANPFRNWKSAEKWKQIGKKVCTCKDMTHPSMRAGRKLGA